ncbi:MAG: hypothetical protein KTR22_03085 [Flavobacteriaceae bacterium]|nr:hypothetical protein [Flavobacteriaceae bacterium]
MTPSNILDRLRKIVPVILDESMDYLELQNALKDFKSLCLEITGLDFATEDARSSIYLENGKAIGPAWAGACIDDIVRTKRFVRGLKKAVDDVKKRKKSEPVSVLYSGTGPFATLVLPLIAVFKPEEVQFVLLEINPVSFESVQQVFKAFNAEDYVTEYLNEDACTIALSNPEQFDVVVVECLQHALAREPQVAITHNLMSQCREDVILIPKSITLHISLLNSAKEIEALTQDHSIDVTDYRMDSKAVFVLDKDIINSVQAPLHPEFSFPKETVRFPEKVVQRMNALAITTLIHTYAEEHISYKESGLTIPKTIKRLDGFNTELIVDAQYRLGKDPELVVRCINE